MRKHDGNCLFCKIIDKKIPAYMVQDGEHAAAFLDITPRTMGHTLVIPKYHAATLADLPDGEIGPFFSAVKSVATLLGDKLGADGLTIGMNQGEASGQVVGHLHVHILPRFKDDGGGAIQSVVHRTPVLSLQEVLRKINSQ